jgi:3-hydroxyacyl-CoA dehydrogenase
MAAPRNTLPAPVIFPGDEPFWEATRDGRLLGKHCPACQQLHYYPRPHCPFCGHRETQWRQLSGKGHVYSYSIVERSPRPTAPAIIELEEGIRLQSVVTDADVYALSIGEAVTLRFLPSQDGPPVPGFTTVRAEQARAYGEQARQALNTAPSPLVDALEQVAVIGSGHMGVGISLAFLQAGLRVQLIDQAQEALDGAQLRIQEALDQELTKGRINADTRHQRLASLTLSMDLSSIKSAGLVVEAVWEDMALKRELFARIDAHAHPDALLATNTSTLDVAVIAQATQRPGAVVGLHFFNPAHVMSLIEIVRTPLTTPRTLQAAQAIASRIGKTGIVVGICDGFVGNRLMIVRERQAGRLLLEGALPHQIDRFLREFGLPMGTFELQDMAGGIALMHRSRQRRGERDWLIQQLFESGRLGMRAGRGFYLYEAGKRRPIVDPEVTTLIEEASRQQGLVRRTIDDAELHDRLILPMINEGAKLISEGIVDRASDIDLVWQLGYGWPQWKGGPMHYADQLGASQIVYRLEALQARHGDMFKPAGLLVELAASGGRLTTPAP